MVCGDALIDLDLTSAIRRHWQSGAMASAVVQEVPAEKVSDYGVVVCDDDGRITSFQEKPSVAEAKSNLVNTGIYIFEPEVLELVPTGEEFDIGSQLFPKLLEQGADFYAIQMAISWVDIGRLSDFWLANQQLMLGKVPDIHMPGEEVRPGVWVGLNVNVDWEHVRFEGPVYIGASSRVEVGCVVVGPTWIGHGCHLQAGTQVSRSIVFEHSRIGSSSQVVDAVVSGRYCVDKDGDPVQQEPEALDWVGDARNLNSLGRTSASA